MRRNPHRCLQLYFLLYMYFYIFGCLCFNVVLVDSSLESLIAVFPTHRLIWGGVPQNQHRLPHIAFRKNAFFKCLTLFIRAATTNRLNRLKSIIKSVGNKFRYRFARLFRPICTIITPLNKSRRCLSIKKKKFS